MSDAKKKRFEELLKDNDLDNYALELNSLKSSARIIGVKELSNLARELEIACNEKNLSLLQEKNSIILEWYDKITKDISLILK